MRRDGTQAAALALAMFVIYNANGREIGSYDSQPTKFAARELLLRGTLSLNYVVGFTPGLAKRSAFVETAGGRYRSAYSPVPAVMAAAITWPLWQTGLIDIRAPRGPGFMAALSSSLLVSLTVGLAFLTARTRLSVTRSLALSAGLGVGTGLWSTVSQTLWQHETAIFGLSLAVYALMTMDRGAWLRSVLIGVGLGLAAGSRLQLMPAVTIALAGVGVSAGWRLAALATACACAVILPVLFLNYQWFGTVLGAAPLLEALHGTVHRTSGSFALQIEGFVGLLVAPNRGLLVFSPIVAVAFLGIPRSLRDGWKSPYRWLVLAAAAQFTLYALYTVWWGGHTFGPRYMLDILPLLVPSAAIGMEALRTPTRGALAFVALAWSVAVAALGAFNYPHERWNSDPVDVDIAHDRLWNVSDTQIRRAWLAGPSPQNFNLFTPEAVRVPQP